MTRGTKEEQIHGGQEGLYRRHTTAAVALIGCLSSGAWGHAACLSYGGRVQLTGTLMRIVFAGPPNYESVARGDQAEPEFVIRLDKAVCVNADPGDEFAVFVPSIRDMMLVLTPPQFGQLRSRLGTRVILSGGLRPAETGHHHTPVMLGEVVLVQ